MKNDDFMDVSDVLRVMGIPPHLLGYNYIACAVPYVAQRMTVLEIYRQVAADLDTVSWRVERNIRSAATASIDRMGWDAAREIYGNTLPMSGVPTNGQLLATAARLVYGISPFLTGKIF